MELESGFEFVYKTLTEDAQIALLTAGQVFEDEAPKEASYPFIVITLQDPEDIQGVNLTRCMVTCTALVRVVGRASEMERMIEIANRVDCALQGASGSISVPEPGGERREVMVVRERPFRSSGWVGDVLFKNLGGFYRVEIGA
jgi:hypothetical protein